MRGARWRAAAAAMLFLALGVLTARILPQVGAAGSCGLRECSLADFRDAVYYPVVAFLRGENPYDKPLFLQRYPVVSNIGIYSPLTLGVHLAFGYLPYAVAAPLFYALSVALTIGLGVVALRICGVPLTAARVLGLGAFLLLSRPGHWNLFTGQVSVTMALATYAALLPRTSPWLAGLGLALATLKPTYGGPLAVLMLVRGDRRAIAIGAGIALLLTGAVLVRLVADAGVEAFGTSLIESFARVDSPKSHVATWPFRVDVGGLARSILGHAPSIGPSIVLALGPLLIAGLGLRRLGHEAPGHAVGLGSLAVVTSIYHQQYDVIALTVPLVALVWPTEDLWRRRPQLRRATLALVGLPFVNYLASGSVADALGLTSSTLLALCVLNNVALLGAFAVFAWLALAEAPPRGALDRPRPPG